MNINRYFTALVIIGILLVGVNGFVGLVAQPRSVVQVANVQYQGNSRCYRCHEEPSQFDKDTGVTSFIGLTEAKDFTSSGSMRLK